MDLRPSQVRNLTFIPISVLTLPTGILVPQLFFFHPAHQDEYPTMTAILLLYTFLSSILQTFLEVGSATFLFIAAVPLFLVLATNATHGGRFDEVPLRTYVLAGIQPWLELRFGAASPTSLSRW